MQWFGRHFAVLCRILDCWSHLYCESKLRLPRKYRWSCGVVVGGTAASWKIACAFQIKRYIPIGDWANTKGNRSSWRWKQHTFEADAVLDGSPSLECIKIHQPVILNRKSAMTNLWKPQRKPFPNQSNPTRMLFLNLYHSSHTFLLFRFRIISLVALGWSYADKAAFLHWWNRGCWGCCLVCVRCLYHVHVRLCSFCLRYVLRCELRKEGIISGRGRRNWIPACGWTRIPQLWSLELSNKRNKPTRRNYWAGGDSIVVCLKSQQPTNFVWRIFKLQYSSWFQLEVANTVNNISNPVNYKQCTSFVRQEQPGEPSSKMEHPWGQWNGFNSSRLLCSMLYDILSHIKTVIFDLVLLICRSTEQGVLGLLRRREV